MPDFTSVINSNTLPEIHMIAGDEQTFVYSVWDNYGNPLNLAYATCGVTIYKYGDTNYTVAILTGSWIRSGSSYNQFSATFSGSDLPGGVYQQQVRILDGHGSSHIPTQGKIVIFSSPNVANSNT